MDIPHIDVAVLAERLQQGSSLLIDVREPDEWDEAHIAAATLIALAELPDRLDEIPRQQEILVICRSGGRSGTASEFLINAGYDAINIAGGMLAWIEAGHEVTSGNDSSL